MASKYVVSVIDPLGATISYASKRKATRDVAANLKAIAAGTRLGSSTVELRTGAANASGTLTLSTASGAVGGVINGVTITATWATSDTNSAALVAAAINASTNALIAGVVTASSALGVVTVTSVLPGVYGNCITLAASGTGVTASGARLTGGTETRTSLSF